MKVNKRIIIMILAVSILLLICSIPIVIAKYTDNKTLYAGQAYIYMEEGVYAKLYDTDSDGEGETLVLNNYPKFSYGTGSLVKEYNTNASNGYTWGDDRPKLKKVVFLTTVKPKSCRGWFLNCRILETIENIRYLDTSNCTDIQYMFTRCQSLKSLDVSNFDTSKITDLCATFQQCSSLTTLDLSSWDVSNVTSLTQLFYGCSSLTSINVSNWNTEKVEDTGATFCGCSSLTEIDISDWYTPNLNSTIVMFDGDTNLRTIYTSIFFITRNVTDSYQMFSRCESLVGMNGTTYASAVANGGASDWIKYARIDTPSNAGLFSIK